MSSAADTQVVKTLKDFCDALLETDCWGDPEYDGIYERLLRELGLSPAVYPVTLSDVFLLIVVRWNNSTLTVSELGALAQFSNKVLR